MSTNDGKWKSALLKTSLPFEYLVAKKLDNAGFSACGGYSYMRPNEDNKETEFSVDIWGIKFDKFINTEFLRCIELLIECKYNYPGVKWVFAQYPNRTEVSIGVINVIQDLCTRRVKKDILCKLDEELPYCIKGIELHENDANPQSIERGLYQLKFAIPYLISSAISSQAVEKFDYDLNMHFICSILVTTATLFVLKDNICLDDIHNANSIDDIAFEVDALIEYQEPGPYLGKYVNKISTEMFESNSCIKERLDEFSPILKKEGMESHLIPNIKSLHSAIKSGTCQNLIVTYNAFDKYIEKIKSLINESGFSLKSYGVLTEDGKIVEK